VKSYPFQEVEAHWQAKWQERKLFEAEPDPSRPPFSIFELPPFPNGKLHIGHVRVYTTGDAIARYRRMRGYNVLYTTGYDAYGLPIEIAAHEKGVHPFDWTERCTAGMGEQFIRLGYSHDRRRILSYHEPRYYKWTQWIFNKLLAADLAYRGQMVVSWCETCETALAESQVENHACWRCHEPAGYRLSHQWFVRESLFADSLLAGLSELGDWPEQVRTTQAAWIGKRPVTLLRFRLEPDAGLDLDIPMESPELSMGIAFVALGLQHPLFDRERPGSALTADVMDIVDRLRATAPVAVRWRDYTQGARTGRLSGVEVQVVPLPLSAVHPLTGQRLPVVATNAYEVNIGPSVLAGVPAHNALSSHIADRLGIAATPVLRDAAGNPVGTKRDVRDSHGSGLFLIHSGNFDGLPIEVARERITAELERRGLGRPAHTYRSRDWNISRQRYWGPPIPVIYCNACGTVPVPDAELPVLLPYDVDFSEPGNPLERHPFAETTCPRCGAKARRETDTFDTFFNGVWPFLSYCVPTRPGGADVNPFLDEEVASWMPMDVAIGGFEHATTVYYHDRVLMRALGRMGLPAYEEPFRRLIGIGMVQMDGRKMSKHFGNTVDPDDLLGSFGADSLRAGILQAAALDNSFNWSTDVVTRAHRFLNRLWEYFHDRTTLFQAWMAHRPGITGDDPLRQKLARWHAAAWRKITFNHERCKYKLVIDNIEQLLARMQQFESMTITRHGSLREADTEALASVGSTLLHALHPITPHITEELWHRCGGAGFLSTATFPDIDQTQVPERDPR